MNRSLARRVQALELRFPDEPVDLSGVPMRDLEALERHMERVLADGEMRDDWESKLPPRLRRVFEEVSGEAARPRRSSIVIA